MAVSNKIADILYEHPQGLHINDITKKTGIDSDKLARILRYLATKHVFREGELTIQPTHAMSDQSLNQLLPVYSAITG